MTTDNSSNDYAARAAALGLDSSQEVQKYLNMPNCVILDVRTEEEIAEDRYVSDKMWASSGCKPFDCHVLADNPESILPDKNAPIVIHCRSGRRAVKAKDILLQKGYKYVVNAGGLDDLRAHEAQKD